MKVFALFACCIPVKGARRSIICDIQKGTFRFIPNGLYGILVEQRGLGAEEIKASYGNEFDEEIDEYFASLVDWQYGFWCDISELGEFPALDLAWEVPEQVTNAILDFDVDSSHDIEKILEQLDDLGCKALEVRFFCQPASGQLAALLKFAERGRLRSIELIIPWVDLESERESIGLITVFNRLSRVTLYSAPENKVCPVQGVARLFLRSEAVDSPRCCGQVNPAYFVVNLKVFSEAQELNTCLNRKVSIDARGEIKNCPSMSTSFGNIRESSLHGALMQANFKEFWLINKDKIEVCKDCEFRYICVDCRAYISNPRDVYSKPSKCTYDPYSAEWND